MQDVLAVQPLTGTSELPSEWEKTFGSNCRPVASTTDWPDRTELRTLLDRQLPRLIGLFESESDRLSQVEAEARRGWGFDRGE
ncbi:MAG: hypothetical protein KY476_14380 [Planctomycetes bacterium]|nr:hypothetical protein [Planctomycetota bacterium]